MTEANRFYIADFHIDLLRSVICKDENEVQIEPKVLKVLLLLAQRQNEVVTHQEIKIQVWQGTEVVPNALQRCIAILRKVLEDDAKAPAIIATHPKIGYRLIAEVRWHQELKPLSSDGLVVADRPHSQRASTTPTTTPTSKGLPVALAAFFLGSLVVIFWPYASLKSHVQAEDSPQSTSTQATFAYATSTPMTYTQITPITRTDAHESQVIFSPDANYMLFNRYAGACKSHLWARHFDSGRETRLTLEPGEYGSLSFTGDGRELVFAAKHRCDMDAETAQLQGQTPEQAQPPGCWSIATLDFSQAMTAPQMPRFRHQCQADKLQTPKALANHQYVFLQSDGGENQLMFYNDLSKELRLLHAPEQQHIYHFDYDPRQQRLAVFSRDNDFNNILELLDERGEVVNRSVIKRLPEMSRYQQFSGDFEPQGDYLLAVSNHRLYRIGVNGELHHIKTPSNNLISVAKHPANTTLLTVLGGKDIDITQISLAEETLTPDQPNLSATTDLNDIHLPFPSIARTSAQERQARFQPDGDKVAFISNRAGRDQLWLWQAGELSPLSSARNQNPIHRYSWSPDGTHLSWALKDKLAITDLKGNVEIIETHKPLFSVLSWFQEKQFLVLLNDPLPGALYHLDIEHNKLTPYGIHQVQSAWVSQNQIIFSNTRGEILARPLQTDNNHTPQRLALNAKAMLVAGQSIYSVDKQSSILSQYDLQGQLIKPLVRLKPTAWKVSDIKGELLLLSQFIAIEQDVVMLQ